MSTITGFDDKTHGWSKAIVQKMGGVDIADAFLRGEYVLTKVMQAIEKFLSFIGKITVDVVSSVDSVEFFRTCEGLWVNDSFQRLFVDKDAKSADQVTLSKYKIEKNTYDSKIVKELPEDHMFEAGEFCQIIASMLTKQWGGKGGDLINNGYANAFYVRSKDKKQVFVVRVRWYSDDRRWRVDIWGLGDDRWDPGRVIFSRN